MSSLRHGKVSKSSSSRSLRSSDRKSKGKKRGGVSQAKLNVEVLEAAQTSHDSSHRVGLVEKRHMRKTVKLEDVDDPFAVEEITAEKIEEFGELFNIVDEDKGGSIDEDELMTLLRMTMGKLLPKPEEVNMIYNEIDADGGGSIEFDEFVAFMTKGVISTLRVDPLKTAFQSLEFPDQPGLVAYEELEDMLLTYLPDKVRDREEIRQLIGHIKFDRDGMLNYEAYINKYISDD